MVTDSFNDSFSSGTAELLFAVATTAPKMEVGLEIDPDRVLRYVAGVLSSDDASELDSVAFNNVGLRRGLAEKVAAIEGFQTTAFGELIQASETYESENRDLKNWIEIVNRQVETVTSNLYGAVTTSWPAIARMAKESADGLTAARTIWRALFSNSNSSVGRVPFQLGFGYRKGTRGAIEPAHLLTHLAGEVLANGDVVIYASTEFGPRERPVFFAYSMNGRALPLAEAQVKNGQVRVVVEGLAHFLQLAVGPIPSANLAATTNDWPEDCKLGHIVVEANAGLTPKLEMPVVRGGYLELTSYFEIPQLEDEWELLLAVTPNSWQMLARFDIKCVIERPQVLKAIMPKTAKEGPFGGALWLRQRSLT